MLGNFRNNIVLRLFAILLFSFELVVSPLLNASLTIPTEENESETIVQHVSPTLTSFLFIEERNEEEREGKDLSLTNDYYFDCLTANSAVKNSHQAIPSNGNHFDTRPPLFKLYCNYLI